MSEYSLQSASREHIQEIIEIANECRLSLWTPGGYAREIESAHSIVCVAVAGDGSVQGFICGKATSTALNDCEEAEIYNIGVRTDVQRSGIGSALLNYFLSSCAEQRVTAVWLEVRMSNINAIAFYTKHRFSRAGVRKKFYRDPTEDALLMRHSR